MAKKKEKTDLVVNDTPINLAEIKEYQDGTILPGLEAADQEDFIIPRARLIQNTSQDLSELKKSGVEPGDLVHSLTGEKIGNRIVFLPVKLLKQRVKFSDEDFTVECISFDTLNGSAHGECEKCNYSKWDKEAGEPPVCNTIYNFIGFIKDSNEPIAISFLRTSVKLAKKIISTCRLKNTMLGATKWEISTYFKKYTKGQAYTYTIRDLGLVSKKDFKRNIDFLQATGNVDLKVEHDQKDGFQE